MKDRLGEPLKVGDVVMVPAIVHADLGSATGQNCTVKVLDRDGTGEFQPIIAISTRLVEKSK